MRRKRFYSIRMKDIPKDDRPRERLIKYGPSSLSNAELFSIIMGTGNKNENVLMLSTRLLSRYSLKELSGVSMEELRKIPGIKDAKACKIMAAMEIGKRISSYAEKKMRIHSPKDVVNIVMPEMRGMKRECLKGLYLDSKCGLIKTEILALGGITSNSVMPREVFRASIIYSSPAVILVHNHPSGDPEPSEEDIKFTKHVIDAGKLLGIEVIDHIIIGDGKYASMREMGII